MPAPKDNRWIMLAGAGAAVIAGVIIAMLFVGRAGDPEATPASPGDLRLDVTEVPDLEPTRELRCFVDGQFVGMATLADCAQRNGVATAALDVGLDETGNLTAAQTAAFAPPPELPPIVEAEVEDQPSAPAPAQPTPAAAPGQPCLRYTGSEWRQVSGDMSLSACVRELFSGVCVRPGDARYGRWGGTTLRLVPRRVEQSTDNTRFRVLAEQDRNCQIGAVG